MALPMTRQDKHPKTGAYWVRKAVPVSLRPVIGKRELVADVGDQGPSEACRRRGARLGQPWQSLSSIQERTVSTFLSTIPMSELTEAHLERLITDGAAESRELEFKRDPYGDSKDAKREFLKDLTALANTFGGHLIIGVAEHSGLASEIIAITDRGFDEEKLRLENLLRDAVEPRLTGVQIQEISIRSGGVALAVRVPKSWNAPHRVLIGDNRFYGRSSAGAFSMDVEQLRAIFLGASDAESRVRQFRDRRLSAISCGDTPVRLQPPNFGTDPNNIGAQIRKATALRPASSHGLLVLHVVPLSPIPQAFDMMRARGLVEEFAPFRENGWYQNRANLDGLLIVAGNEQDQNVSAYAQVFRTGQIETVRPMQYRPDFVSPREVRVGLVDAVPRYLKGLGALGYDPPFVVMASLLDMKGISLVSQHGGHLFPADREDLVIDPIIIDANNLASSVETYLLPIFDAFWNAFGVLQAPAFDSSAWNPPY